jgi:hypothetical protein
MAGIIEGEGTMREILGKAKTVRELLTGVKYSIDYYQTALS